ncbi:four helix bundle protein [Pontibacter sp. SGAir0037]|uniref:four helix bundle protein n=1 Tax=Pontibacter sp. SGAir0037 TaxID=2571030 RepID=UPI0010CD4381|nr:four helix bundle protein [Pontibacter sp. SGAir0037]QCR23564.1 four helix bundle protein [Pontibacter sp. SGAir0037]
MEAERLRNYDFAEQFKARTKAFALRVIKLVQALSNNLKAQILGKQLLRAGTSVAANYRAACRARSNNEFISKIGVVLEEAEIISASRLALLKEEAKAITGILTKARQSSVAKRKL